MNKAFGSLNYEAYLEMKRLAGRISEAPGAENDDLIIEFHSVTTYRATQDSVPHCSSGMTWAILQACIKRNPYEAFISLNKAKLSPLAILTAFKRAGYDFDGSHLRGVAPAEITRHLLLGAAESYLPRTSFLIEPPTYSAAAVSYCDWGVSVKGQAYQVGDVMVFTRANGHHVGFYEDSLLLSYLLLGANQNDMVCVSDKYLKTRLLDVRRSKV